MEFGIAGTPNRENFELFKKKLVEHMTDPSTKIIEGTFKKVIQVTHYFNEDTGLNVMVRKDNDNFLSGWAVTENQGTNIKNNGKL